MTLIKCKDCGADVSTDAKNCPKCGAKVKKPMGLVGKALLGIFAAAIGMTAINAAREPHQSPPTTAQPPKSAASEAEDLKRGLAIAKAATLINAIKHNAKVPSSLKIESASWMPSDALCIELQGQNTFGTLVPSIAVIPPGTNTSPVIGSSRDPAAGHAWNTHCAGKSGEELAGIVRMRID